MGIGFENGLDLSLCRGDSIMIRIEVDNRLRIQLNELPAGIAEALRAEFQHSNPTYFKQRARILANLRYRGRKVDPDTITVRGEPKVIINWEERNGVLSLPRGGTAIVRQVFSSNGLEEPDWEDRRVQGSKKIGPIEQCHGLILWEHQEEAVLAAMERQNCLVRAATGSGKTSAAIALAVRCGLPTIVIVWSANLFDQWIERLSKELGIDKSDIGQIRGSKRILKPITMAMQQTLYANPELVQRIAPLFGCVMADEVQRFAAKTFNEVIDKFPARYRIGWSADETRKDKKEFLIYDVFGTVAADISREKLVKRKLVHEVEVRVVPTEFKADWYVAQQSSDTESPDFNRLLEGMTKDPKRNLIATSIARTMMGLGHQVLMLTHRREHAALMVRTEMQNGTKAGLLLGGPENVGEFNDTVKAMRAGAMAFAAGTYQAIGQGLDIPTVERGVAATPIASNRQFFGQVQGRLCRIAPGKKDAVLYYLWDHHVFGIEPIMKLKRWTKVVMVQDVDGWLDADTFVSEWNKQRKK